MADTIKAFVERDFRDAGTEQQFAAGDVVQIDAGAFANYEAGGLVRKATAQDKPRTAAADAA